MPHELEDYLCRRNDYQKMSFHLQRLEVSTVRLRSNAGSHTSALAFATQQIIKSRRFGTVSTYTGDARR